MCAQVSIAFTSHKKFKAQSLYSNYTLCTLTLAKAAAD